MNFVNDFQFLCLSLEKWIKIDLWIVHALRNHKKFSSRRSRKILCAERYLDVTTVSLIQFLIGNSGNFPPELYLNLS